MYRQSRKMLTFLVVTFLATQISILGIGIIQSKLFMGGKLQLHLFVRLVRQTLSAELVLSGIHLCAYEFEGDGVFLTEMVWVILAAWEILALCLAVWISVQHFRERPSTGWAVGDCFTILIETHVFYFAR